MHSLLGIIGIAIISTGLPACGGDKPTKATGDQETSSGKPAPKAQPQGDPRVDKLGPTMVEGTIITLGKNIGWEAKEKKNTKAGWIGTFQLGTQSGHASTYRIFRVTLADLGGAAGRQLGETIRKQNQKADVAYAAGDKKTVVVICAGEAKNYAPSKIERCSPGEGRRVLDAILGKRS